MAAHPSRARWGREVATAVPLRHVGRWVRPTAGAALVAGRVRDVVVSCALGIGRELRRTSVNKVFVRLRGSTSLCCRSYFCGRHDEIRTNRAWIS